jgi:hypothetical protein
MSKCCVCGCDTVGKGPCSQKCCDEDERRINALQNCQDPLTRKIWDMVDDMLDDFGELECEKRMQNPQLCRECGGKNLRTTFGHYTHGTKTDLGVWNPRKTICIECGHIEIGV